MFKEKDKQLCYYV